jgi:hypothetical protein
MIDARPSSAVPGCRRSCEDSTEGIFTATAAKLLVAIVATIFGTVSLESDADGRYRVNEVFCGEEVWPDARPSLLDVSDVMLLDARGFTSAHPGGRLEIQRLAKLTRLDRILAVVDDTTDHALLVATVEEAASPGLATSALALRVCTVKNSSILETHRLFAALCGLVEAGEEASAASGRGSPIRRLT